ncbi:AAA family ATPase [Vibrio vulnificus]
MLTYFSVKNFRSIRDELALDMRPAPRLRRLPNHVLTCTNVKTGEETKLLRTAVIYGANASGKSNIVKAIEHAKNFVLDKDRGPAQPFKLDNNKYEDTTFYFEFSLMGYNFAYGFSYNKERVSHEYLYDLNYKKEVKIFERTFNRDSLEYDSSTDLVMSDDDDDKRQHQEFLMLIKYTQDSKLFVTEAYQKKLDKKLNKIATGSVTPYHFFRACLMTIFPNTYFAGKFKDINENQISKGYKHFLNRYDTGISDICTERAELDGLPNDLIVRAKSFLESNESYSAHYQGKYYNFSLNDGGDLICNKIITCRTDIDGGRVDFELDEESDGTARLFDLLKPLVPSNNDFEITYIIDEFDRSLHPNVSKDMIKTFLNNKDYANKRQLIVTTHESNILDNDLLRRDEIWFVQKEKDLSTSMYSLNDYSTRFDKDIKNAYLRGAFGGVPYLMDEYKG